MQMTRRGMLAGAVALALTGAARAGQVPAFRFDNIDGGSFDLTAWRGQPVLVVNTASLCGLDRKSVV